MRAITRVEFDSIVEAMENGSGGRSTTRGVTYRRNHQISTILQTQARTGLRVGDVLSLSLSSFVKMQDGNYRFDIVEQKTKKPRTFKIAKRVYNDLQTYAAAQGITDKKQRLFTVKERAVQKYLDIVCEDLELESVSTHSFRKFYATELYERSGHDIELVRRALQHSSVQTTQRYLGLTDERTNELVSTIDY